MEEAPERRHRPSRRTVLRAGVGGLAALLAGCTRDVGDEFPPNAKAPVADLVPDLPVDERSDELEAAIEEGEQAVSEPADLEAVLDERDYPVESLAEADDAMTVEYAIPGQSARGSIRGVGLVAGGYAALVAGGIETALLEFTIRDPGSSTYGHGTVETAWAEAYDAGERSAGEYGELVLKSVETRREPG